MLVDGLVIPDRLLRAIEAGRWPRTPEEALKQNLRSLVEEDRIRRLAAEESKIYLYSPPFSTVARVMAGNGANFYKRFGAVDEIVPEAAVEIADFGLGADSPILLDYRGGPTNPTVIRLFWPGDRSPNRWVTMAPNFATFIEALGL